VRKKAKAPQGEGKVTKGETVHTLYGRHTETSKNQFGEGRHKKEDLAREKCKSPNFCWITKEKEKKNSVRSESTNSFKLEDELRWHVGEG